MKDNLLVPKTSEPEKKFMQRIDFRNLVVLMFILEVITLCAAIYFGYQITKLKKEAKIAQNVNETQQKSKDLNWETYTDTKYNFVVKYPRTWEISLDPAISQIATNELLSDNLYLIIVDKGQSLSCGPYECFPSFQVSKPIVNNQKIELSFDDQVNQYISLKIPGIKINKTTDFVHFDLNGQQAIKYGETTFVKHGEETFAMNFDYSGSSTGKTRNLVQPDFDEILASFKFLQ